jgi:hypothetical protein
MEEVAALDAQKKDFASLCVCAEKNRMFMPSFFMVLGSIFIAMNFYKTGSLDYRAVPGAAFILFGIALIFINRR